LSFSRVLLALAVASGVGWGSAVGVSRAVEDLSESAPPEPWFAPYVDATLTPSFHFEDPSLNPADDAVLSFIVGDRAGRCVPTWGTYYDLDSAGSSLDLDRRIARLRQRGGDVIVSFGGVANEELARDCRNDDDLLDAYQSVITRYDLTTVDFDIEGEALTDHVANDRRARVVQRLQADARADGRSLAVWLTLPVAPTGLSAEAVSVVDAMLAAGVDLAGVNVMTMNYGASREAGVDIVEASASALDATWRQVGAAYRRAGVALRDETVWHKLGATPMIGQNDEPRDRLTVADADRFLAIARERGLGRLSLWSLNRDIACGAQLDLGAVSDRCSGVRQEPLAFTTVFDSLPGRVATAAHARTRSDRPAEPRDDPDHSPYPIWSEEKRYTKDAKVTWHHNVYEAKWWTQGNAPDEPVVNEWDTPWRYLGPVLPGDRPAPTTTVPDGTYAEWEPDLVYVKGDRVQLDGVPYQAKWWTRGEQPKVEVIEEGDTPWQRLEEPSAD
jgi:chitinase